MANNPDKPIEQVDLAQLGYAFRDTDKVPVVLTDAAGAFTGQSVLVDLSVLRGLFTPPDIFQTAAPTVGTTGRLNQRYYHSREVVNGQPTRADLYVYNGTAWSLQVLGFVLDAVGVSSGPLVGLTLSASAITLGQSITLTAPPSSATATSFSVVLYEDSQPIGTVTTAPWQVNWQPATTGKHVYVAVATDNLGKTGTSLTRNLQVSAASNILPDVALEASPDNINLGQTTQLVASAYDPNGSISLLEIFTDASLSTRLAQGTTGSLTFTWQPPTAGQKLPVARATDNQGGVKVSSAAPVMVVGPTVPVITFPAPGNKVVGDAPFTLNATSTNTGTPITYSSSNAGVISVSGNTATVVGAGTVTLTASQVAGNNYSAGSAAQSVTVTVPAGPPVYSGVVSSTLPQDSPGESEGMVFASDGPQRVEFDKIFNTKGNIAQLQITDTSGGPTVYLSYPDEYVGRPFTFYRASGGGYTTQPYPADGNNLTL